MEETFNTRTTLDDSFFTTFAKSIGSYLNTHYWIALIIVIYIAVMVILWLIVLYAYITTNGETFKQWGVATPRMVESDRFTGTPSPSEIGASGSVSNRHLYTTDNNEIDDMSLLNQ